MQIGHWKLENPLILAPMAGITDLPFRQLCRKLGAGLAVSEMVTSDPVLWDTRKSTQRRDHSGEMEPISVQIAGTEPAQLANAARLNVDHGAQIIDINMGCPAKKVCKKAAGAALLRDEKLVGSILEAVVNAVDVPVTLKIRTGWSPECRNALRIAAIAENAGIKALAVHGRTRACRFAGRAEYDTIARIKARIGIPVIANGDIDSVDKARRVLDCTGADGLMIGRAAQGWPWIFAELLHGLGYTEQPPEVSLRTQHTTISEHLRQLHGFYGEYSGVRIARKHLGWYLGPAPEHDKYKKLINRAENADEQLAILDAFFEYKNTKHRDHTWEGLGHGSTRHYKAAAGA